MGFCFSKFISLFFQGMLFLGFFLMKMGFGLEFIECCSLQSQVRSQFKKKLQGTCVNITVVDWCRRDRVCLGVGFGLRVKIKRIRFKFKVKRVIKRVIRG